MSRGTLPNDLPTKNWFHCRSGQASSIRIQSSAGGHIFQPGLSSRVSRWTLGVPGNRLKHNPDPARTTTLERTPEWKVSGRQEHPRSRMLGHSRMARKGRKSGMESHLPAEQTGCRKSGVCSPTRSLMGPGLRQVTQPLSLLTDQMHSRCIRLMRLHQQAGLWAPPSVGGIVTVTGFVFDSVVLLKT